MDVERAARLKAETEILDAYAAALNRRHEVLDSIFESETVEEAEVAVSHLLGVSRVGAKAIMNMQLRRVTRTDRERVIADRDDHRRQLSGSADD